MSGEPAGLVEYNELVIAADGFAADEDLGHGSSPGDLSQPESLGVVVGDIDFLIRDAPLREQPLGRYAVRANTRRVEDHVRRHQRLAC